MAPRRATGILLGLVLVGAVGGGGGCGSVFVSAPVPFQKPAVLPSTEQLQARLAAQRSQVRALRALADSEIAGPEGRVRASEILLVEPPSRLRLEVLSTFGVVWILATNGEVLDVYSRHDETVYRGTPTADLVGYYLPIPLALADLTELLLGRPPPREVARADGVAWEAETGLIRLVLVLRDGGRQTLWFDGRTGLLQRCEERDAADGLRFDLRVKAYREVEGVLVASDLRILTPDGIRVRLAYANCDLNPTLSPDLFRIPFVVGAREAPLGARLPY